jgi:hypothetical protein
MYEMTHPTTTWDKVQWAFINRFSEICNERQMATTLRYAKQKKYESIEDYYDKFLQLYMVIPQQPHDIYLSEAFRKGLRTKIKMVIISMLQKTLAKISKSTIMINEEMSIRKKSIARYHQDSDSEESKDFDEEEKWKPKKKKQKITLKLLKEVYCQNCYNERHLTKECKLLNKFC